MNNSFSFNRFWLLVVRQWAENKITYTIIWCLISLLMIYLGLFSYKFDNAVYILMYCFGGAIIMIPSFSRWPDFGRSSGYLLIPASLAEKFLSDLFYSMVLFTIVYCLTYFIMTYLVTYLIVFLFFHNNLLPFHEVMKGAINDITFIPFRTYLVFFLSFMFVQSVCLICVIRFNKNQLLIFFLIFFVVMFLYNVGMHKLISDLAHIKGGILRTPGSFLTFMSPDFGYQKNVNNQNVSEFFSFTKLIGDFNRLIWFVVFSMLYFSAWLKFREREL